ncbi:MAG TPA: glycosyltransferase [Rhizomicrobium sp.]|jgi:glycosyltransferase involved in cell wall biosynthesis|nr:glycosyltransferase [Rhizomicrobium sp.]
MKVSVIIPHYSDLAALDCCLAGLQNQTFPAENMEIIVADNASPQGAQAVSDLIAGRARLVIVPQKGAGPARNGGVAASHGEILAFIDSDCQPNAEWISQGVAALAKNDFVGGSVEVLVQDPLRISAAEAFECVFAFDMERYVLDKGFAGAGNLFCPRTVFDAVGGFGVGLSEDVDWSRRATGKGFRLGYAKGAIVGHPARRTWSELQRKWVRINAETYALTTRAPGGRLKWTLLCLALPISALVHTVKVIRTDKLRGANQRMSALAVLYRLRIWRMFDSFRLLYSTRGA